MAVSDSDWLLIADGTTNYKVSAADLAEYVNINSPSAGSGGGGGGDDDGPPPIATFSWNSDTDLYTRDPVADRIIDVPSRIRRCLLSPTGTPTYLDADNGYKLATDWLRICETRELDTEYTGTVGEEVANTALRADVPDFVAFTVYTRGQRVIHDGSVWECIVDSATATPAAGTVVADLNGGSAGQVMVQIPRFSVRHETAPSGSHKQHTFHMIRGTKVDDGFAVHPAFITPINSYREFIYVGAYHASGDDGNLSRSGVWNRTGMTRSEARIACSSRGAGWHQLGYWEYNALQWLLMTEYQDMNSQRVLGIGSASGGVFEVSQGVSNSQGNRTSNALGGGSTDFISYRGIENIYGRAFQWIDGINVQDLAVYLSDNPAHWADNTATNYTASGKVPNTASNPAYQRDVMDGIALLPSSIEMGNASSYISDSVWSRQVGGTWRVATVGGSANTATQQGGVFCLEIKRDSSFAEPAFGHRLAFASEG